MKKRRKSPHFQYPVHYLVKAGFTRGEALRILKAGTVPVRAIEEPHALEPTVSKAYAEGLKDALSIVLTRFT